MNPKNSQNRAIDRDALILFSLTIIIRIIWHSIAGYTADDAFITFRYAENIAAGEGFVYNSLQQVQGTTTPLFTLIMSLPAMLSANLPHTALVINSISSGITAVLLLKITRTLKFEHFAVLPSILFIFFPRVLITDTAGMETAFFTMLTVAALYFNNRQNLPLTLLFASLAALTRPEGYILLFIVGVYHLFINFKQILKFSFIPILLILPWIIFSWQYFGTPIPHSIPAKLALYSQFGTMSMTNSLSFLLALHNPFGIALTILSAVGIIYLLLTKRFGICEAVWIIALIDMLAISKTHLFIWYITPVYPFMLLFAVGGFLYIIRRIPHVSSYLKYFAPIIITILAILLSTVSYIIACIKSDRQYTLEQVHKAVGLYLAEEVQAGEIVAAEDIGYIGYFSGKQILDRDGLVSPEAVPYNREGNYFGLIQDFSPQWVVAYTSSKISEFVSSPEFLQLYQTDSTFKAIEPISYTVYKKRF